MKNKPTMEYNEPVNGIELKFEKKPSADILAQVKEQGFRWHRAKQVWFAKKTPERDKFSRTLCGLETEKQVPAPEKEKSEPEKVPEKAEKAAPNTFASCYDKIGDAAILKDADSTLMQYMEAYCEKEQLYYRRTYGGDSIHITDLSNAQKTGKNCDTWHIYPSLDCDRSSSFLSKLQNAGAETIGQLVELCRSGEKFEDIDISKREEKGVDVFSPFVEVKPLKELPEKWTKRNFAQALMSGQLFRGEVAYRYTDDYAYDAAYDFGSGQGLDMASFAKSEVGDWGACTSCYNSKEGPDKTGTSKVNYSEHSNSSKTLYFDVNCNIAEGKRRAEARATALENYNKMMEASCIQVSPEEIDPKKVYHVVELDMNSNTGAYGPKESNLQGKVLRDRLDPDCRLMNILSIEEMQIQPDKFYSVANFHDRLPAREAEDKRIIPVGNWGHIVSGKALLELTAEGRYFPRIEEPYGDIGPSFESALANLTKHANGTYRYMVPEANTDYNASIDMLISEYERAGGTVRSVPIHSQNSNVIGFDAILKSAQDRQKIRSGSPNKSNVLDFNRS